MPDNSQLDKPEFKKLDDRLVTIRTDDGSTHTRRAAEWVELARRDLLSAKSSSSLALTDENLREIAKKHARHATRPHPHSTPHALDMIGMQEAIRAEEVIFYAMKELIRSVPSDASSAATETTDSCDEVQADPWGDREWINGLRQAAAICDREAESCKGYEGAIGNAAIWGAEANAMRHCAKKIREHIDSFPSASATKEIEKCVGCGIEKRLMNGPCSAECRINEVPPASTKQDGCGQCGHEDDGHYSGCPTERSSVPPTSARDELRHARALLMRAWEKSGEGALGPIAKLITNLDAELSGMSAATSSAMARGEPTPAMIAAGATHEWSGGYDRNGSHASGQYEDYKLGLKHAFGDYGAPVAAAEIYKAMVRAIDTPATSKEDPGTLKLITSLVERAYGIFTASGVLRVAEQDPDSDDPIVAWASDVRSILYRNKPAAIDATLQAVDMRKA